MERKKYRVQVEEEIREYEEGITFEEIAKDFQPKYEHPIVLGQEGYKLLELNKTLTRDYRIRFITTGETAGNKTYKRSVCLLKPRLNRFVMNGKIYARWNDKLDWIYIGEGE